MHFILNTNNAAVRTLTGDLHKIRACKFRNTKHTKSEVNTVVHCSSQRVERKQKFSVNRQKAQLLGKRMSRFHVTATIANDTIRCEHVDIGTEIY